MAGIVHIVGTGTIGEPLIGLMADNKETFGIDEVTFHKRTPLLHERGKVNDLCGGAPGCRWTPTAGTGSRSWATPPSWERGRPSRGLRW